MRQASGLSFGSLSIEHGPIGCPELSVRNYHYSLHNNLEERCSHQRSIKFCILLIHDKEIGAEKHPFY
jgi:hypothetical protein